MTQLKKHKVHRLILLTFKGKSDLIVNHINGDKKDNNLENLEYVTYSENLKHAYEVLNRKKGGFKKGKLNPRNKEYLIDNDLLGH